MTIGGGSSAGTAYVDLVPRLDPSFNRQLSDAVDNATRPALARMSEGFRSAGQNMMQAGTKLSLGLTLPIAAVGVAAFQLASDLNESMSKVNVVFGSQADAIVDWSKTAARSFGLSRQEALESAGTLGNLFRAMEIGEKPAADMSRSMVQLAGDLASFNNANPKDVLEALRSGLVGETEPLRRFGINLNQARIEAKALELGLWDGEEAISASAKTQAAYALILEDSTLAQGDYARTADGAANRQRTLEATMRDLGATLGTILLPIGEKLLGWLQRATGLWDRLSPKMESIVVIVLAIAAAVGPLLFVLGGLATAIGVLLSPVGLVLAALAALAVAAYVVYKNWSDIWPKVQQVAQQVWTWLDEHAGFVADAIRGIIAGVVWIKDHWREIWEGVKTKAAEVWTWLQVNVGPTFELIAQAVAVALDRISNYVSAVVAVIQFVWQTFGDRILEAARITWEYVKGIVAGVLEVIRGLLQIFIGIFTLDWETFWSGVQGVLSGAWSLIENTVRTGFDTLLNIFGFMKDLLGIAWEALWSLIKSAVSAAWDGIRSAVSSGVDAVVNLIAGLPGRFLDYVGDMASAGAELGSALLGAMVRAITDAGGVAADIGEGLAGIVRGAWNVFADSVNDAIPNSIPIPFFPDIDLPDNPIPRLHSGIDRVPGGARDEMLAILQGGERVMSRAQVRADDGRARRETNYNGPMIFPRVTDAAGVVRVFRRLRDNEGR